MVLRVGWLIAASMTLLPSAADATTFVLTGSCDGSRAALRVIAQDHGDKPEIVAFHVYRHPIAVGCRGLERVTPQPIPRQDKTEYALALADEKVQPGIAYEYKLVGVDEQSNEFELPYAVPTWVGCGDAPVAHGFVEDAGWALVVEPACTLHCNPPAPIAEWPADIDAWVGRRIPVLLFGSVGWRDAAGPTMTVSEWRLETCTTSVEQTPWTIVKRLYR